MISIHKHERGGDNDTDYLQSNNRLETVVMSANVTNIGDNTFRNNRLTSVDLTDVLKYIGEGVFRSDRLITLDIPGLGDVLEIGMFV